MKCRFLFLLFTFFATFGAARPNSSAIRVNPEAIQFARQLIREGRIRLDQKGAWGRDQPSVAQKSEYIRVRGPEAYSKWHLGVDSRHRNGSKAHCKFPFGDFEVLHRCGLLAVKARAHEYGYADIEAAAAQLLQLIESSGPTRQKRID
jgi:hypothetical protein